MLTAAVIGVGSMGRNHARVYSKLDEARLVGVSDLIHTTAQEVGALYGVPAYQDYREMLAEVRPTVVSITVPTANHVEIGIAAMHAGAHVLIEKPIADTLEGGYRLIHAAQSFERQLMVGHIVRYNPAVQLLKEKLSKGELGRIFQITCRRVGPFPARIRDVGVVVDLATHDLDVMRYLTAMEPTRVFAETEHRINTEQEDLMLALLRFPGGITGSLEVNWLTPNKVREILVLGEHGLFRVDDLAQDLFFYENADQSGVLWHPRESIKGVSEGAMTRYALKRREPLQAELHAFLAAIRTGKPVPVSGEDGIAALRLALALVESGKRNQVIWMTNEPARAA